MYELTVRPPPRRSQREKPPISEILLYEIDLTHSGPFHPAVLPQTHVTFVPDNIKALDSISGQLAKYSSL